jgi:twinkle protein
MTLHQYGIPALSVPFGAGTGKKQEWIENEFDNLAIFDEIFLCFDNDTAGQQSIPELVERLGHHRCRVVSLPYKDANACLQNDVSKEQMQGYFAKAASCDPMELRAADTFVEQVISDFYPPTIGLTGIKSPWKKTEQKILFRPAELSVWCGINGHGKSQFIGHIVLSTMQQGEKVCIASLELKPERLLMRLTRQAAGLDTPSSEYIRAIHQWYKGKLWLFDVTGTTKVERLLSVFLYARQRYGIKTFVIDSLMKCGMAEDDYNAQKRLVEQLCDFKNRYDCHIHLITHPRKGIDERSPPGKMDLKGTGSLTDLADNCFIIWRNKTKESKLEDVLASNTPMEDELLDQFDCLWICNKQRNGDWEGKVGLWFDKKSYQFLEHRKQKVSHFVDYSK